jgi:hypothetical protein
MLRNLQNALSEKHPTPTQTASGLRQALIAVYASQVGLIVLTAIAVWIIRAPVPRNLGWAWWLLALSAVMYGSIAFFAEREFGRARSFKNALQLAILLGVASALPAVFALLVMILEGLGIGAWVLLFASLQALIFGGLRVTVAAYRIQVQTDSSLLETDSLSEASSSAASNSVASNSSLN